MKLRDDIMLYGKLAQQKLGYVAGQVEVTSKCFQHCKYCLSWTDKSYGGEMPFSELRDFVQDLCEYFPMFEHLTLTGGDPQAWLPLNEFLEWWCREGFFRTIDLQISTALARDIKIPKLWQDAIKDLRVSVDASSDKMYHRIRGDQENTCNTILARLVTLRHPSLAIITTVYPDNLGELKPLLFSLDNLYRKGLAMRKIIVMMGIGIELDNNFKCYWREIKQWAEINLQISTSFADDIIAVRAQCNSPVTDLVQCWASKLGFHIKPSGDVYPCCLVGGEAIEVQKEFKMGNIFEQGLVDIYNSYTPTRYAMKPVCREVCQFKQLQINLAGEFASKTKLAIP